MKYFLKILLTPNCWLRNYGYCKHLNKRILKELKNPIFTEVREHSATINGLQLWVSNYPRAYGTTYKGQLLPSRYTVFKLRDALNKHIANS